MSPLYNKFRQLNSNGFTLVEVIASISLLAMASAVLLPVFPQMMGWSQMTGEKLEASNAIGKVTYEIQHDTAIVSSAYTSIKKCPQTTPINYSMDIEYSVRLGLCQSAEEAELGLVRTKIELYSAEGLVSESYTYIEEGETND